MDNVRRVGAVTIGQSPRIDLVPEFMPIIGPLAAVVEVGALDHLPEEEICALEPGEGDAVLVSRLRDGRQVRMRRDAILGLVQEAFDSLAGKVDLMLMLCTGTLPKFVTPHLTLYPEHLLFHMVCGILGDAYLPSGAVGVITPVAEQVEEQEARWSKVLGARPGVAACSPYELEGQAGRLRTAAEGLVAGGAKLIVLDCLGYTQEMKQIVYQASGVPVVLARTTLARVAAELLDDGLGAW